MPAVDAWATAAYYLKSGKVLESVVKATNRGGVLVDCWGVQGVV